MGSDLSMKNYKITIVRKNAEKKKLTQELYENIREIDRQEIECMGFSTMQGVEISIRDTCPVYVARTAKEGKLIACWGLQVLDFHKRDDTHEYTYIVWALGTDHLNHYAKSFVREASGIINRWVELYGCLQNSVACFNKKSIRWLKWMGAEFSEPHRIGNTDYVDFKIKKKGK